MTYWFTADLHLSHENIIGYCNRPFHTVSEMDDVIIKNFQVIKPDDHLYILGDVAWDLNALKQFWATLKTTNIWVVFGNHDKGIRNFLKVHCCNVGEIMKVRIPDEDSENGKQRIIICHYAMRSWEGSHTGSWQLYGHSHGTLRPYGLQMDVGVDCNNFKPFSYDDVKKHMLVQKKRKEQTP